MDMQAVKLNTDQAQAFAAVILPHIKIYIENNHDKYNDWLKKELPDKTHKKSKN